MPFLSFNYCLRLRGAWGSSPTPIARSDAQSAPQSCCIALGEVVIRHHRLLCPNHWTVSSTCVECCVDPDVPVIVIVYWPVGVPGLPPPFGLLPPHAAWKSKPANSTEHSR